VTSGPFGAAGQPRLGVVVVGTGAGGTTHVLALRRAGFDVLALVGRDPDRTKARAARFHVPHAATSLEEALARRGVHAVTIATPPHSHAALTLEAVAAGKHVVCATPFTRNRAEALTVLAAAERAGVVHLLGSADRYRPGPALLAAAVRDGRIGDPRLGLWLKQAFVADDRAVSVPVWWTDEAQGGGWLGVPGASVIDQVRATLGDMTGVSAHLVRVDGQVRAAADEQAQRSVDGVVVHFRTRGGCAGVLQGTADDAGVVFETRVTGTAGTAWIDSAGSAVTVADDSGIHTLPVPDQLTLLPPPLHASAAAACGGDATATASFDPWVRMATAFRQRILGLEAPGPVPATFDDGVAQMTVVDAVRTSAARGGAWTPVDGRRGTGDG
jgi:predicted dehydrogenase